MKKRIILFPLILLLFTGCATRVSYSRMKPSEIDMSDARHIAIFHMDEQTGGPSVKVMSLWELLVVMSGYESYDLEDQLNKRVANYATQKLTESLASTEYFEMIDPQTVNQLINGRNLSNQSESEMGAMLGVDAVVVGSISTLYWKDTPYSDLKRIYNQDGTEQVVTVNYIKREYSFSMGYRVIKTNSGTVITSRIFEKRTSDRELVENKDYLRDPEQVFHSMINDIVRQIKKQLAPYPVRERRSLSKDKAKDPRLVQAAELVKNGLYDKALDIFINVWESTRNQSAGYNASIMYELRTELNKALNIMDEVLKYYPDKNNMQRIAKLRQIMEEQNRVSQQYQ